MKKQIIAARNCKHLYTPHKPGTGISYDDKRFGKKYDIGICTTSRGRCLITWGLNLGSADIVHGTRYVCTGRDFYEVIIEELGHGRI